MAIPRGEYPRPQFERSDWVCLNGRWEFEIDTGDSGLERGLVERELAGQIEAPFCPESALSGVGKTDFLNAVWYRRRVRIPEGWAGKKVLLHFQAVDYDATVWVNGVEVRRHRGGFTPFTCDLAGVVGAGDEATIVVRARDDIRQHQPGGKQSRAYANCGCYYTRTTGIWQPVWMEPVNEVHLLRPRITPDVAGGRFRIEQPVSENRTGCRLRVVLKDEQGEVARAEAAIDGDFSPSVTLEIPEDRRRLWSCSDPHLYGLAFELVDERGRVLDEATSYAGLRGVTIDGKRFLINGEPVFQRLVLDQGYYPDGIMTAPTDEALVKDIALSQAAGFNGARLHQKVFEERFLYHADRMGYLVWGEYGDWGFRAREIPSAHAHQPGAAIITQWLEALERDYSHPCIVGWCPLNETAQDIEDGIVMLDDVTRGMFLATKAMDSTRPVLDASGYSHRVRETDVYDCHHYEQDPVKLKEAMSGLADGKPFLNGEGRTWSVPYGGQPFWVSEFGGIWWNPEAASLEGTDTKTSWGYGGRPRDVEDFCLRFEGLCKVLLDDPNMFGYCYTQLTDVVQEEYGIYLFARRAKFDLGRIRKAQAGPAACEKSNGDKAM